MKLVKLIFAISILGASVQAFVVIKPKTITDAKKTEIKLSLGANKSTGNEKNQRVRLGSYISIGNGTDSKHLLIGSYNFEEANEMRSVNRGMLHYRYTKKIYKVLDGEYFIQDEFDEFTNQKNRFLIGYNNRLKINAISNSTFIGTGTFYSNIIPTDTNIDIKHEMIRLNLYAITSIDISETTTLSGMFFYQPSLYNFKSKESLDFVDFRINSSLSIENKITNSLSMEVGVSYNYNSNPFVGILKEDFKTVFEINYKIPVE